MEGQAVEAASSVDPLVAALLGAAVGALVAFVGSYLLQHRTFAREDRARAIDLLGQAQMLHGEAASSASLMRQFIETNGPIGMLAGVGEDSWRDHGPRILAELKDVEKATVVTRAFRRMDRIRTVLATYSATAGASSTTPLTPEYHSTMEDIAADIEAGAEVLRDLIGRLEGDLKDPAS